MSNVEDVFSDDDFFAETTTKKEGSMVLMANKTEHYFETLCFRKTSK